MVIFKMARTTLPLAEKKAPKFPVLPTNRKLISFFSSFLSFCFFVGTLRLPVTITDEKEFLSCYDLFENFLVKRGKVLFWKLEWIDQVSVYWFVTDILL